MPTTKREQAKLLQDAIIDLHRTPDLKVGDVIEWRPGLRNRRLPKTGFVAIVSEVFEKPMVNEEAEHSSPYYLEPLHGKMALMDDDGDILEYVVDFTRFKKVTV